MPDSLHSEALHELHLATAIYTTASAVDELLDRLAWPGLGEHLFDPSAGNGAIVIGALDRLELAPDDVAGAAAVRGWEIYPQAVAEARRRIAAHLCRRRWTVGAASCAAAAMVRVADFLTEDELPAGPQVIAGNPPYIRYARLPVPFKELYRQAVPSHARQDLAHAFLDRVARMVEAGGRAGLILPDRWLFNETASDLRVALGRRVGLAHVRRISPATSFYRPKERRRGTPPRVHPVECILTPAAEAPVSLTRAAISPDTGRARDLGDGPTLGDVAQIYLAPYLGPDGIFVVDEAIAATLAGAELVQVVKPRDIDPHADRLRIRARRFAIVTRPGIEPPAAVLSHLQGSFGAMPPRGRQRSASRSWWLPPETIAQPLDREAILVPRIATRLRAVDLPPGLLPLNHAMTVVGVGAAPTEDLRAYLRGDAARAWIATHAARLEGGCISITTSLLRKLPVPPAFLLSATAAGRGRSRGRA